MTFELIETSSFEGTPIELFEFTRPGSTFRYTSHDEDITVAGTLYTGIFPIERTKIEASSDPGRNPIKVKASSDLPFATQYVEAPPGDVINLTIKTFHENDVNGEVIVIWIGRVTNVSFQGEEATLRCEPIFTSLKRPALRRLYQTACPHLLYGPVCTANRLTFLVPSAITVTDPLTYTSAEIGAQADNYFSGGFITWDNSGVVERRTILTHIGTSITINSPIPDISTGQSIDIYPGCDHTLATCVNKFNNVDNYGGFPFIPEKNPFSGTSVF